MRRGLEQHRARAGARDAVGAAAGQGAVRAAGPRRVLLRKHGQRGAFEEGRVRPGNLVLMPGFGGGLTLCSHLVKWGERVTPLGISDAELPPCTKSALELVNEIRATKKRSGSEAGLMNMKFVEDRTAV